MMDDGGRTRVGFELEMEDIACVYGLDCTFDWMGEAPTVSFCSVTCN